MVFQGTPPPAGQRKRCGELHRAMCLTASLFFACLAFPAQANTGNDAIWLSVDTQALTLSVMRADVAVQVFENIAIGSNGATLHKQVGDEMTPLGKFRINVIRPSKRFRLFMGIDYPTMEDALRALEEKRIGATEFHALEQAWQAGRAPPQDTRLGGHLGIHGVGAGSLEIHNRFNWTNGCIAVTNEQLEELAALVRVGATIVIH